MKLRNKKTGAIGELQITRKHCAVSVGNGTASCGIEIYSSLDELNKDWEDYEETKDHWHIGCEGDIFIDITEKSFQNYLLIGNDFETREEAERALEKLKAWKRLKDKGLRFIPEASYIEEQPTETKKGIMFIACTMNDYQDFVFGDNDDIKLLFGVKMTVKRLNQNQISMIKQMLTRMFSDPFVEVPVVNTVLQILGYAGYFDFNEDTYKITWRLHKHDKGKE